MGQVGKAQTSHGKRKEGSVRLKQLEVENDQIYKAYQDMLNNSRG